MKSLASGRTVRATLPGATDQALRSVPGADSIEIRGETVLIHSGDADKVARYLLTETSAHDLEITSRGLEEAFLALTGDDDRHHHWREPVTTTATAAELQQARPRRWAGSASRC